MLTIDINCDMGESFGNFRLGNDEKVFPYISSCNIACGFHAGDPLHMERTIDLALEHDVQMGAHPSYPDLNGFGRRKMHLAPDELRTLVKYQVSALKGMVESRGGKLSYVKPHGALYNSIAHDPQEALSVIQALREIGDELMLMGLAGSPIEKLAKQQGIPFVPEAFADRYYESNGRLRARSLEKSVISDPQEAAQQVLGIVQDKQLQSWDGNKVPIQARSICIHGDNPKAVDLLKAIDAMLTQHGIHKQAFSQ